jgi:acyl-CoA synthetase (AMP-forming)/AMP-acid ligase II
MGGENGFQCKLFRALGNNQLNSLNQQMNPQTLIHHFLEGSAARVPQKTALIHEGRRVTYEEINSQANGLAHHLTERGVTRGDRVALLFENCLEFVVSYYGSLKAGAAVALLTTELKTEGLKKILCELEPKVIISSSRFEKLLGTANLSQFALQELILKSPVINKPSALYKVEKFEEIVQEKHAFDPNIHIPDTDPACLIYTSGSTGLPKGVVLSHRNIVSNTLSICEYLELTHKDIQMVVLPFFYVMGKSLLNTHFAVGGSVVINNKFAYPAAVLNEMVSEKITGFSGVPSTYAYLLHRSPLRSFRDRLESLRYCSQAGGHMSRTIKQELRRVLASHVKIYIMYGASEAAARLSYLEPSRYGDKMDSIGKAIPGVTLRILNPNGEELPTGETGEIVATGPNIMQGYWKDPETTAQVLDGNGYHTGDQGYRDEEGFFYVVGRKDDLLKVSGHRVNCSEIEETLMESEMLVESVVLGVPDDLMGHRLIALVVPRNDHCSEKDLLAYVARRLPRYKTPGEIKVARRLPKSASGKIDRTECMRLLQETAA